MLIARPTARSATCASRPSATRVIVPIVLLVVFVVLAVLLRAIVLPVILIATVVLSFLAALGVGAFFFEFVFDFLGLDPSLPLWAFVFLVALGTDRQHLPDGARARGGAAPRDTAGDGAGWRSPAG